MDSSLWSTLNEIPSGPGAEFLLLFPRMRLISRGFMCAVENGVNSVLSGEVGS